MKSLSRIPAITLPLFFLLLLIASRGSAQSAWHENYNEAVKEAQEEKKGLLIVYTGTEWIEMCKIFYRDILSQEEFLEPAGERLALLKLEYNKENTAKRDVAMQKQLLKDAYRIQGFPTVVLTDATGRPFAFNGYQPVTAAEYAETILGMEKLMQERMAKLKEAESLEGLEKAKALGAAIPELPGNLAARYFREEMESVLEADPENETGFRDTFTRLIADVEYSKNMQRLSKEVEWVKMLQLTDRYIEENNLEGVEKQAALMNKYGVQRKVGDPKGIIQSLLEVVEVDPESSIGKNAQKILDKWRAQSIESQLVP